VCSQCGEDIAIHDTEPVVGRGRVMHPHARGIKAAPGARACAV
jgi:hypothetical protein